MNKDIYIGLGSNIGDRRANLNAAIEVFRSDPKIQFVRASAMYETPPLGGAEQPTYLNAVAQIETTLEPTVLLETLKAIETRLGRRTTERWQPRPLDLDVLLYGDRVIQTPELSVPHPQMHLRSFVLKGLCELDGDVVHPVLRRSAARLYARLNGRDFYLDAARPQLISIAGLIGVGKTTLATRLTECLNGRLIAEKYDDNPYLADVYAGRTELALDSELFFLASSTTQLRTDRLTRKQTYVSDYIFEKALIYASSWLNDGDLMQYRKHYACAQDQVVQPALTLFVTDTVDHCLDRIHRRNRPYEQRIEPGFLDVLMHKYDSLFTDWTASPVVRIEAAACETVEQVKLLAEEFSHYVAVSI